MNNLWGWMKFVGIPMLVIIVVLSGLLSFSYQLGKYNGERSCDISTAPLTEKNYAAGMTRCQDIMEFQSLIEAISKMKDDMPESITGSGDDNTTTIAESE